MNPIDLSIRIAYWCVALGWVVILPLCIVGFFAGGWFVLVGYLVLWDWVKQARSDIKAVAATDAGQTLSQQITKRCDWALARADDQMPNLLIQRNGEQDIGNVVGSQDLGYRPVWRAFPVAAFPPQMQCQTCRAKFEPPYPQRCAYCDRTTFRLAPSFGPMSRPSDEPPPRTEMRNG